MDINFHKSTGLSLIIGSLLACLTMVLHPSGGNIEHIIGMASSFKISHSIGIYSMPLMMFGFLGLSNKLMDKWKLSNLAFIIVTFGLLSAALAALFNGIALPHFLSQYTNNHEENNNLLRVIMNYGFAINRGLDYMFITSLCTAIALYSFIIIRTKKIPNWISIYGLTILGFSIIGGLTNFAFTSLIGFRIIVFAIAGWVLCTGFALIKSIK